MFWENIKDAPQMKNTPIFKKEKYILNTTKNKLSKIKYHFLGTKLNAAVLTEASKSKSDCY